MRRMETVGGGCGEVLFVDCLNECEGFCMAACHCFAPRLMFFMVPSARVINQGAEPRVSRVIRLGEQINCERAAASERKVPLIVEEGAHAGT